MTVGVVTSRRAEGSVSAASVKEGAAAGQDARRGAKLSDGYRKDALCTVARARGQSRWALRNPEYGKSDPLAPHLRLPQSTVHSPGAEELRCVQI